ncbi:ABC transporter substrate-binding protein [Robertmurraya andreesenii]|uniref:Peptide/nickel transport system substrate-binding protein n=1 Tax=Anoxybacillus andreesenii TaxID=1325932 RepID=A0ABT9UZA8_9BACL|nr:ABC transporter substrate-binding protein [Robertmurraya andreesenii]MDQ0154021.1 peptide/nickel transport system substrate-binding protein [Robertmurraya andreesenii]
MKRKYLGLLIALGMILFAAVGCSNNDKESKDSNEATKSNKSYDDEMNIAVTAQPPTLDSVMTVSQVALDIAGNIYETLYTLNEKYEPTPMLAKSVDVSDDGKTYTFHLREGVKFHNGKEMASDDVVASMNRWLEKSSRAKSLLGGAKFETQDPYTTVLHLEKPSSDVLIAMASQSNFPAIMPKEIIESAPAEGVTEYIGTGPFKFKEWKQDQFIHLVKNDDYQAVGEKPSGFAGKKEALVNDVYYHFVTDHSTRIAGIQTGEYDIADNIPTESYEQLSTMDHVKVHTFEGGTLTMFFNVNEGPLADVKLRQAVNTALNMDEILLASFVNEDLYELNPSYMNPNQPQWASDAGKKVYNQGDLEKAKKLLKEAGYNGEEITLLTTQDYGEMYTATIVVQEQLRQLGMNVKVANYDFPTFLEKKNDRSSWDIFITSNGYQLIPPQLLALTPDWAGNDNPQIKALIAEIREAETPEAAKAKWDELQGFLYEYLSSTVIGQYKSILATTDKLEDFEVFEAPIIWNTKVVK